MNSPRISIIVPVYKAERYIRRCIDSILAQTYTNWELLLIDDGSPDCSGNICDDYASNDYRIRVFHKENGGVSSARNVGLDNACGEWIAFIDSDDYVDAEYCTIEESLQGCDVIQKHHIRVSGLISQKRLSTTYDIIKGNDNVVKYYANHYIGSLWNKLIKRSIIANKKFSSEIKIGEDLLFFVSLLDSISSYGFSNKGCYYYMINNTSAMNEVWNNPLKRIEYNRKLNDRISLVCTSLNMRKLFYVLTYREIITLMFKNRTSLTFKQICELKQYILTVKSLDLFNFKTKINFFLIKYYILLTT